MDAMSEATAKRKRGRPKGSKNKPKPPAKGPTPDDVAPAPSTAPAATAAEQPTGADIAVITLTVPLGPIHGYQTQRIDISRLTLRQADTLGRLVSALDAQHARQANGRHVENAQHAVRWLLDEIDRQLEG